MAGAASRAASQWWPAGVLLAACALWTGVGIGYEAGGRVLGTAAPPFVAGPSPSSSSPWLALGVLACAIALWRVGRRGSGWLLWLLGLALVLLVNAARGGPGEWTETLEVSTREGRNEYLASLGALSYGRDFFLDRFAELVPTLSPHAAGHPPGLLVAVDLLGLTTPELLAGACIAAAAALAPLTFALARACSLDDDRAWLAGVLALGSPAVILYGGTSADAVYAALGTAAALLLAASVHSPPGSRGGMDVHLLGGASALAIASLFAWSLLGIGAWAAVYAWRVAGIAGAVRVATACGIAVAAVNLLLAAGYGYDPLGTLQATEQAYRDSLAAVRPYWFWVVGSPVAFLVTLGLPTAAALPRALQNRHAPAMAFGVVIAIAALAGFTKAEVERIWLPFVPLAAVAAASVLPPRMTQGLLAALLAQTLLTSVLLDTLW